MPSALSKVVRRGVNSSAFTRNLAAPRPTKLLNAVEQAIDQPSQFESESVSKQVAISDSLPPLDDAFIQAAELASYDAEEFHSFSGSDVRVIIEVTDPDGSGKARTKHLHEVTTFTVSVHRQKAPARSLGYIGPKGFGRHTRTIAGTITLTTYTVDVLYRFLLAGAQEPAKDNSFRKVDQLPPFNITLLFADEYGHVSFRRLTGVDILTSGDVYSITDMYSEQTITYMASDFTPLVPLSHDGLLLNANAGAQKTPKDVLREGNASKLPAPNMDPGPAPAVNSLPVGNGTWDAMVGSWDQYTLSWGDLQ